MLATWNFTASPQPWYDEGVNLQAAANLARGIGYGLLYDDAGALHPFDVQLTTGPTVIGPVALSFALFGVGLPEGRVVMLVYALLAALGLYHAGRRLYGPQVGLVAVLLLCAADEAGPASTRDVVGEVAGFAYFAWGVCLLASAEADSQFTSYASAGLLLGLAVVTKAQFGLVLPALVVAWSMSRKTPVQKLAATVAALTLPVAAWQTVEFALLGRDAIIPHLRDQVAILSVSANVPALSRTAVAAQYLVSSALGLAGLAGLAYVWYRGLRTGRRYCSTSDLLLPTFATAWLVWFLGFSMGWPRYAVTLAGTGSLFASALLCDLWRAMQSQLRIGFLLVLVTAVAFGIVLHLGDLARPPEPAAQETAELLTNLVEPEATTESFEWELDTLGLQHFHHPPRCVSCPAVPYDVPANARYLVDGPSSKVSQLYRRELAQHRYTLLASFGPYDLYRRETSE
jgi:hypothetical protein